ncbi:hypothetical protein B7H23_04380 [Notoacmeibacter marinus]|uniref:Aminoglycoside phosphotransferase domain-containing protein n=1 Tax=Notoacmeibacter marinus TaxID=1876515 RepID=A0A231V232_9HYPH|nr:phosphotransferase family protein [Notoacmeibacter marinus]OXT02164.1 hypothetical protein B7H23_04380 [Notoacmeibacter marinus]
MLQPGRNSNPAQFNYPGLDLERLAAHLSRHGLTLDRSIDPKRFSAGYGNMNFLLQIEDKPLVLRRPPLGPVPRGANDMAREYRILSGLHPALPLVPKGEHFCDDPSVIGAPFLLMEYRPGLVIGSDISAETLNGWGGQEPIGLVVGARIIDVLSQLHAVDPDACGLGTLGRPADFATRTLDGWRKRAHLVWDSTAPDDLVVLLSWLSNHPPEAANPPTLIHNDFKLDNIILDPETLTPRTLIDWDMGTLGNPLYDLAVLLSYWTDAADPEPMHQLRQMPTARHGFPSREDAARLYAQASGRILNDFAFYRVLATLRIAVVFQQLYRRFEQGGTDDAEFARFDELSRGLLRFGVQVARGQYY